MIHYYRKSYNLPSCFGFIDRWMKITLHLVLEKKICLNCHYKQTKGIKVCLQGSRKVGCPAHTKIKQFMLKFQITDDEKRKTAYSQNAKGKKKDASTTKRSAIC